MAKTSADFEKEFIESAKKVTGKSVQEWLPVLKKAGLSKQKETTDWLKKEMGMNHLQATLLAGLYLNNGQPVYMNENDLLGNLLAKCEEMKPLFEQVSKKILGAFPDAQLIAKKTYISYTAKREFAAINVKPKEIRLGMDLGDKPFNDPVSKSKLTGPMPRISHMIVLTDLKQFDSGVMKLLRESYDRSHIKSL